MPEILNLSGITIACEETRSWELGQVLVKAAGRTWKAEFNTDIDRQETFRSLTLIEDLAYPFMEGRILLGPMLKLRGNFAEFWCLSAMLVTENVPVMPGPLSFNVNSQGESLSAAPVCFYTQNNNQMWRFDFQVKLTDIEQTVTYRIPGWIGGKEFSFSIPARTQKPGILFCSCNDRAHPYNMSPSERVHKSIGWDYMLQQVSKEKYHLLLLGGDQIYADGLFYACESVRGWDHLPSKEKYANSVAYFNEKTVAELNCFYFSIYVFCWAYRAMSAVAASVPTAMIYDDHDIYDGWGSLDPHINDSDFMINIFKVAKKYFFLFQMQGDLSSVLAERIVDEDPEIVRRTKDTAPFDPYGYPQFLHDQGPFNTALELTGGVSVVLLDLRTERRMFTHNQGIIMRENSYRNFEKFLATRAQRQEKQHMFVVLTVPIHFPDSGAFNKILDMTHHNLIDDVRDHYSAAIHKDERARILNDLAAFCVSSAAGSRATILSGDVHLACFSTAEVLLRGLHNVHIEQYVSSGIAAKAPPLFAQRIMGTPVFRNRDKMATDLSQIIQAMQRLPTGKYYFRASNFLCLHPTPNTYNAMWVGCPPLRKAQKNSYELENPLLPPVNFTRPIS
eukprot:Phypoly_transcript_04041.p1 GENE.Phypoly_transcript_04041~~Phypoly_transcript_04041.p1  ORF type:complete len:618 (+),score=75.57 Phypoly_transcript_04041:305-2158(+)